MSMINNVFDALDRQTRAMRWAIMALVFMAGFLVWSEVIDPIRITWAEEVAEIERDIAEVRSASRLARDFDLHRNAIITMGRVDLPQRPEIAYRRVSESLTRILDSRRAQITNDQWDLSTGRRLDRRDAEALMGRDRVVERLTGKLEFEAEAQIVSDVLKDLEMSEHIQYVRVIRLTHQGRNRLRAVIDFEAWVVGPDQQR